LTNKRLAYLPITKNKIMHVECFTFNPFAENTFVVYDNSKECIIIDPGCYTQAEKNQLTAFIDSENLTPVKLINTHCHIDHIIGNEFIAKTYGLQVEANEHEQLNISVLLRVAQMYNIPGVAESPPITKFINEGDVIAFGNSTLEVLFVPGHSPGHLAFVSNEHDFVIQGDVLFRGSIGRTDLPGGNYKTLMQSIHEKMLQLPNSMRVYCGHGPDTTIGFERDNNPYLQ